MISVIIPVYNSESFIAACLDQILKKNQCVFEVIALDDGSTDRSGEILDSYAAKDSRVRVIHQANQGNSLTRQNGIALAKGDRILFVDADDELEAHALDQLNAAADPLADIVGFGFTTDFVAENYHLTRTYPKQIYDSSFGAAYYYLKNGGFNLVWNKLYRTELLQGHTDFPKMRITGQDFLFNCSVFPRARMVQMIPNVLYHYKKRAQETMVTRYVQNGAENLKRKGTALYGMLKQYGQPDSSAYADYMLREYEVYVVNLFAKDCPMTKTEKICAIQSNIFSDQAFPVILKGKPISRYSRIFRHVALHRDAAYLVRFYSGLNFFRNRFSGLYHLVRKQLYHQ